MSELDDGTLMRIWSVIEGRLDSEHVTEEELRAFAEILAEMEMERIAEWQPMPGLH